MKMLYYSTNYLEFFETKLSHLSYDVGNSVDELANILVSDKSTLLLCQNLFHILFHNYQLSIINYLELLSQNKVEVRAAKSSCLVFVEAPSPVNTKQTKHRQEYAHTNSCRPFQFEWVELLEFCPAVATFQKSQHPYC